MYQYPWYLIRGYLNAFRYYLTHNPLPFEADKDLVLELAKFLSIRGALDGPREKDFSIGMRSGPVDELWHKWLMWTGHYINGCNYALGYVVHHAPLDMAKVDPDEWVNRHIRFRSAYRAAFGQISPVWGTWASIEAEYRGMLRRNDPA